MQFRMQFPTTVQPCLYRKRAPWVLCAAATHAHGWGGSRTARSRKRAPAPTLQPATSSCVGWWMSYYSPVAKHCPKCTASRIGPLERLIKFVPP